MSDTFEGQESDVVGFDEIGAMLGSLRDGGDSAEMIDFRRFFDRLPQPARFFSADEFMVLGPSNGNPASQCHGKNSFPEKALWTNAAPLIAAMDAIREELGQPIRITNCYRAPPYNDCVGGVTSSMHRAFKAADFVCSQGPSGDWAAAAARVRDRGLFRGGIGIYRTFVHVDVRGSDANWDNR